MSSRALHQFPVHLGKGASAHVLPEYTGDPAWYDNISRLHPSDGAEGRLVSLHTFDAPWDSWEMHPHGHELVLCTAGEIVLIQQLPDGTLQEVRLLAGEYAINPPGVWHTADVSGAATALFITAGEGTEHRPR
jgi:hypothetical protein